MAVEIYFMFHMHPMKDETVYDFYQRAKQLRRHVRAKEQPPDDLFMLKFLGGLEMDTAMMAAFDSVNTAWKLNVERGHADSLDKFMIKFRDTQRHIKAAGNQTQQQPAYQPNRSNQSSGGRNHGRPARGGTTPTGPGSGPGQTPTRSPALSTLSLSADDGRRKPSSPLKTEMSKAWSDFKAYAKSKNWVEPYNSPRTKRGVLFPCPL